jgi:hypothetical protein
MVAYWVVVFTGLRAAVMDYALMPIATAAGVKKTRDQVRFCEQAWLLVYYMFFWTLGMVGPSLYCTTGVASISDDTTPLVYHD